jgi:mono/diheme cytochrome c family protein
MKARFLLLWILSGWAMAGCTFSLASDITPPPDYVPPTPAPTLGALYPASAPDMQAGAALFAQNCAPCHGTSGLGNGPQSQQLPVPVPAIGLADIARSASPAEWFSTVSQGNLDRFMPPFVGALSDQQRWDVVAYVLSLHATPAQVAQGKFLFESNCPACASQFSDQKKMAALSDDDLVRLIKNGDPPIPAFGKNLSDDQALDVALYIRTLTFGNAVAAAPATPLAGTPGAGAGSGASAANTAAVSGSIQPSTGGALPAGATVTLYGYDHNLQSNSLEQALDMTVTAADDGTFQFANVPMVADRIFEAEVTYEGVKYQSGFGTAAAVASPLALPAIQLHEVSTDFSLLTMNQVHIYSDFATQGQAQFIEIYAFSNTSDKTVVVSNDGATIPFIQLPDGAQNAGYQADSGSAPLSAMDKGVAAPPANKPYAIIVFFNMPYTGQLQIHQPFAIDAPSVVLLIPDGMNVSGGQLTSAGLQTIQNNKYQEFSAGDFKAGSALDISVSGQPPSGPIQIPETVVIGLAALGLALIGAAIWILTRDTRPRVSAASTSPDFGSAGEVMDAILALDDLHRAGRIPDEVYKSRRAQLKRALKDLA